MILLRPARFVRRVATSQKWSARDFNVDMNGMMLAGGDG